MKKLFSKPGIKTAAYLAITLVFSSVTAHAAGPSVMILDDYDEPAPLQTHAVYGTPTSDTAKMTINQIGLSVPGGARDTTLRMYGNPLNSIAAVAIGDGNVSTTQGVGVTAETIVSYGAFTRVGADPRIGGPRIGLDLSRYSAFEIVFAGAEDVLNVNVTYYTSRPLKSDDLLYYASGGVNVIPEETGAPLTVTLPVSNNPLFNWRQVDGIVILINRAGPTPATSYTLDTVRFVP